MLEIISSHHRTLLVLVVVVVDGGALSRSIAHDGLLDDDVVIGVSN